MKRSMCSMPISSSKWRIGAHIFQSGFTARTVRRSLTISKKTLAERAMSMNSAMPASSATSVSILSIIATSHSLLRQCCGGGSGAAAPALMVKRCLPSGETPEQQSEYDGDPEQQVHGCPIEHQRGQDVGGGEVATAIAEAGQFVQLAVIGARATQLDAEGAGKGRLGPAGVRRGVLFGITQRRAPRRFGVGTTAEERGAGD